MSTTCGHPVAGVVTTPPAGVHEEGAQAPVCAQPACIDEAVAWVERVTRKPAHHLLDVQKAEVSA